MTIAQKLHNIIGESHYYTVSGFKLHGFQKHRLLVSINM